MTGRYSRTLSGYALCVSAGQACRSGALWIQAILDKFRGVDIDAIIADLLRRFPDMDQYERDHLESAVAIWKARLDMISPDDVVKVILR